VSPVLSRGRNQGGGSRRIAERPHLREAVVLAAALGNYPLLLTGAYQLSFEVGASLVVLSHPALCMAALYLLWRGDRWPQKVVAAAAAVLNAVVWGFGLWLSGIENSWRLQRSVIVGFFVIGIAVLVVAVFYLLRRGNLRSRNALAAAVAIATIAITIVLGWLLSIELEAARNRPDTCQGFSCLHFSLWDMFEDDPATGILWAWVLTASPLLNLGALFALWRGHKANR
jgi:hypothetical protein